MSSTSVANQSSLVRVAAAGGESAPAPARVDPKPVDSKPVDSKPVDSKPVDWTNRGPSSIEIAPQDMVRGQSGLTLALLVLLLSLIFLRPWDRFPALQAVKPVSITIAALGAAWMLNRPSFNIFADTSIKPLLALFLIVLETAPISYWPGKSAEIAFALAQQAVVFVFIAHLVSTHVNFRRLITLMVACCAFHGAYAAKTFVETRHGGKRVFGATGGDFGDPNDLALCLVMIFPFAWWLFVSASSSRARLFALGSALLMLAGVLGTQSRGGLLALGAAVFVIGCRSRESIVYLVGTLGLGAVVALFVFPDELLERYASITEYKSDQSAMNRLSVWKAGLRMFADHPITGVGAGAFPFVYGNFYIDRQGAGNVWRAAHSTYVQIAAESGIVGVAAWVALIFSGFWTLKRARLMLRAHPEDEQLMNLARWCDACTATLFGYVVGAIFLSRAHDMVLIVILAMAAAALRIAQAHDARRAETWDESAPITQLSAAS